MTEGSSAGRAVERAVGSRLRRVRQELGLSLQAVEVRSSREFRASVLGAYERGERSISVPRLHRLATLYDVPVEVLLPNPEPVVEPARDRPTKESATDLNVVLASLDEPDRELLLRYVRMIQSQRRGDPKDSRSIRSEDLRAIDFLLGPTSRRANSNGGA